MSHPDAMYRRIADDLRARIVDGTYRPGDQLPTERKLMADYRVSRVVPRAALAILETEKYIVRQHGRGSFVADVLPPPVPGEGATVPPRRWLSVAEAADLLGVSGAHLYRAIQEGGFPALKIRNRWVVPAGALDVIEANLLTRGGTFDAADWWRLAIEATTTTTTTEDERRARIEEDDQ